MLLDTICAERGNDGWRHLVGLGLVCMDSSICVATITGFPTRLHSLIQECKCKDKMARYVVFCFVCVQTWPPEWELNPHVIRKTRGVLAA